MDLLVAGEGGTLDKQLRQCQRAGREDRCCPLRVQDTRQCGVAVQGGPSANTIEQFTDGVSPVVSWCLYWSCALMKSPLVPELLHVNT